MTEVIATAESKLHDLRARLAALDAQDRDRRAKIVALGASIEAAAESAALAGDSSSVTRLRAQRDKLQAEAAAAVDVRTALGRLVATAEAEHATELEALRGEHVKEAGAALAKEAAAVHAAIAALGDACAAYLSASAAYAALAREDSRDFRGHPARVRESLRGVITVQLREFAAAQGSIPSGGKFPTLYGARASDWLES